VEELVNSAIRQSLKVSADLMTKDEATKKGAMALFGEKYGDRVRVLSMGQFSCELCGGTHVKNTNEIGLFKIIIETSLASGVRRIEAITSETAMEYLTHRSKILSDIEKEFSVKEEKVLGKIHSLQIELKEKTKTIEQLNDKIQNFESQNLFNNQTPVKNNLFLTVAKSPSIDPGNMRKLADIFVEKYPQGILLLYGLEGEKVSIILKTHRENSSINCAELIKNSLPLFNARGGGKPDMAQASGDAQKLKEVLNYFGEQLK